MQLKSYYKVRFNDCDPLGHLNNSKYIDYMLNAREDHLKEFHDIELVRFHRQGRGKRYMERKIQHIDKKLEELKQVRSMLVEISNAPMDDCRLMKVLHQLDR